MATNNRLRQFTALSLLVVPPPSVSSLVAWYPWHRNVPCTPTCESHIVRPLHIINKRRVSVSLCAGSDHTETDEELMESLFKESATESTSAIISEAGETKNVPSHFIQGKAAIGIGGDAGFVYDINALKRNLVQESVKGCKHELLVLLEDGRQNLGITSKSARLPTWRRDRDDLIEERLSALVQVCSSICTFSNSKPII